MFGAAKVGEAAVALDSVTLLGPEVTGAPNSSTCVHARVKVLPSGSVVPALERVTVCPALMPDWSGPALAAGPTLDASTMAIVWVAVVVVAPSLTDRRNRTVPG